MTGFSVLWMPANLHLARQAAVIRPSIETAHCHRIVYPAERLAGLDW
jgi:hypothetical protein